MGRYFWKENLIAFINYVYISDNWTRITLHMRLNHDFVIQTSCKQPSPTITFRCLKPSTGLPSTHPVWLTRCVRSSQCLLLVPRSLSVQVTNSPQCHYRCQQKSCIITGRLRKLGLWVPCCLSLCSTAIERCEPDDLLVGLVLF
jgi:hypothetical protein